MQPRPRRCLLLIGLALMLVLPLTVRSAGTLELNRASRAELESLPGIGPALAERLLQARAQAEFRSWAELQARVSGIGPVLARRLSAQGLRIEGLPFEGAPARPSSSPSHPSSAASPQTR
jgi:competence protein ComEA